MPILDDVNGPLRPGAGYINMNIAMDGTRVSAVRAFLRPALSRPNLTLLLGGLLESRGMHSAVHPSRTWRLHGFAAKPYWSWCLVTFVVGFSYRWQLTIPRSNT